MFRYSPICRSTRFAGLGSALAIMLALAPSASAPSASLGNTFAGLPRGALPILADSSTGTTNAPDSTLEVPWNGIYWQTMPNFTWAACDVTRHARMVIDMAIAQWSSAAAKQGIPIRLTEVPCTNGNSQAQLQIFEQAATDIPGIMVDRDFTGLTLVSDANNRICGIDVPAQCVAQTASIFLFTDNWELSGLTFAQAAKTVAHEIGHAIGLGHAHFCNFDSLMAQGCEPILQGLGPDDVQSIDALVDTVRGYFNLPPVRAQPPATPATRGNSVTYHTGYNLVAGPRGTSFSAALNPLYTFLPGDTNYRSIPASQPSYDSYGYWAYFTKDTTVQLAGPGAPFFSAVATPGQWFLLGNESGTNPMRVIGGTLGVYLYDAQAGQYKASDTLPPGQAAWVRADSGGFIAVASTTLTDDQIACYLNLGEPTKCS